MLEVAPTRICAHLTDQNVWTNAIKNPPTPREYSSAVGSVTDVDETAIVVVRLGSPLLWTLPIDSRRPPCPCTTVARMASTSCTFQSPPYDLHLHGPSRHQRRR